MYTGRSTSRFDRDAGNRFGEAGSVCVIEEFIKGEELSFMAMVDGQHVMPFASSQDHKRLLDADQGPNTGGMGHTTGSLV